MIGSPVMARPSVLACLAHGLAMLAAAGCNDHRYGFFGDEVGETAGETTDTTTGRDPTATVPTTVDPSVPDPSVPDPSDPSNPDPTTPDPSTTSTTDPTDPSGPGTITATMTDTSEPPPPPVECDPIALPAVVPFETQGDNIDEPDLFPSPCVGVSGPEAVWIWAAPFDGQFTFDTVGSSFDTVLTVLDGVCEGGVLGCNDDTVELWSSVTVKLSAGQPVTLLVEGLGEQVGQISLRINETEPPPPTMCEPAVDLGSELGGFAASTLFGVNNEFGSCGGDASPELMATWRAPFAAEFRMQTTGSNFDPVIYVRLGDCHGPELVCNDDFNALESQVDLFATPDDGVMFLFVDGAGGAAGDFNLSITAL